MKRQGLVLALAALMILGWSGDATAAVATPCGVAPEGYNVIVSGDAVIEGTDGPDFICAGHQANRIMGLGGNDIIHGRGGADTIIGGRGDDVISGGGGDDVVRGGLGNDQLSGELGHDELRGDAGSDWINGGSKNDVLWGGDGDDILIGRDGHDEMWGGAGNDRMRGGLGRDAMRGGDGRDVLRGDNGPDRISGDDGPDFIHGRGGVDYCFRARVVRGCELDRLLLTHFVVTDQQVVHSPGFLEVPDADGGFEPNGDVTIRAWSDDSLTTLLHPPRTVRSSVKGGWMIVLDSPLPVGAVVEVIDESTGELLSRGVDVVITDVNNAGNRVSGLAAPGSFINVHHLPVYVEAPIQAGFAVADANGAWTIELEKLGNYQQTLTVRARDAAGNELIWDQPVAKSAPLLYVSQHHVVGLLGGWTPGETVSISVGGSTIASGVPVRPDGTFLYVDWTQEILAYGDQVTVVESTTGRSDSATLLITFNGFYIDEFGSLVAQGTAPLGQKIWVTLVDDDGVIHRNHGSTAHGITTWGAVFDPDLTYVSGSVVYENRFGDLIGFIL